jgi:hypothetical protein
MTWFVRCHGKAYCLEGADGCRTCSRSRREIDTIRSLVTQAANFILEQGYDNAGDFTSYLAEKIERKVRHARDGDGECSKTS